MRYLLLFLSLVYNEFYFFCYCFPLLVTASLQIFIGQEIVGVTVEDIGTMPPQDLLPAVAEIRIGGLL